MKKLLIVATIFIFHAATSNAQSPENYIGFKGGLSIPNLTAGGSDKNPLNTGYSSRTGLDFAIFYETGFSDHFSLITQLEYSSQGGKKNGYQAFPLPAQYAAFFNQLGQSPPPYLYADYKSEAKINYLMLSELVKVNFPLVSNSPLSIYIDAGPFGGLLLSAKHVQNGSSKIYADDKMQQQLTPASISLDDKEDIKDQLHKGNFGITGDVGIALNINNSKIFIEGGGNYGFLNIQKGNDNGKNHIGAATARIGYAFGF